MLQKVNETGILGRRTMEGNMSRSTYHVAAYPVTYSDSDALIYALPVNKNRSLRAAKARRIAETCRLRFEIHRNSCFDVTIVARENGKSRELTIDKLTTKWVWEQEQLG